MEGPVSARRVKRRTIHTIAIFMVAVVVLIAVVIGVGYIPEQTGNEQSARQTSLDATATQLAEQIAQPVVAAAAQFEKLLQGSRLAELLSAGDQEALQADVDALQAQIPSALKLRVFLPGEYHEDRESRPPLGFASLDLLKQAEKSPGNPDAEILGFGSPDAHLVLVRRIRDADGNLLGLAHLSLAVEPFIEPDETVMSAGGYAELVQITGESPLPLVKLGDARYRQGTPVSNAIKSARWRVDYWSPSVMAPGSAGGKGEGNQLLYMAAALLLIVLVAAGFVFMRRKPATTTGETEAEESETVVFAGAIKAIMEGKHPGLERLIPNLPRLGQAQTVKPVSQGLTEGEDITLMPSVKAEVDQDKPPTAPVKKTAAPEPKAAASGVETPAPQTPSADTVVPAGIPAVIFRAYDIRGIVGKTLTVDLVTGIGKAIGSEARERGQSGIVVGRDGRTSSPELADALIRGLREAGCDVIDIGQIPTPVLYFATHHLEANSGVMVTGSHNGPAYNGLKIVLNGETLSGEAIQALRQRLENGNFASGQGSLRNTDITADYLRRATEDIPVALGGAFKLVVDCGNGVSGAIAPQLYRALGHDVIELYCEIDGRFPNHHPDPSQPDNLRDLIARVRETGADLGFAFDGDGDRLGVVDGDGNIIWPDRQMMLFARDVLSRNQGASVIFDVKCSRHLKSVIEAGGGQPLMWKTGHSLIKNKMKEVNAPLAGEMSGHIFFKERWYGFDDAMYAGARMLEILAGSKIKPAEVFAELPGDIATPELRIPLAEKHHARFMQMLHKKVTFADAEITDIDGLRADFPEGWGLIRPSNTTPCLIARFEAQDEAALKKIQAAFHELILSIAPDLKLPF